MIKRLQDVLPDAPQLGTGAGHDAGILANAEIPAAMIFVRNPTGISHSPAEFAERDDCLAGVEAPGRCPARAGGRRRMSTYWAEHVQLPGGLASRVRFEVADGRFGAVEAGSRPAAR